MKSFLGKKFPAFTLLDQQGNEVTNKNLLGKKAIIYFYPKDMTPGCTLEAQGFRDLEKEFKKAGVVIVGVSPDSAKRHSTFCEKEKLPFSLLADEDKKLIDACGVWVKKRRPGASARTERDGASHDEKIFQQENTFDKKKMMGREYMGVERVTYLLDEKGVVIKEYAVVKPIEHPKEVLDQVRSMR